MMQAALVKTASGCLKWAGMQLTEKWLLSVGGWQAFNAAKAMYRAGRVLEAAYEPPFLRGKVAGERPMPAGLRIKSAGDVENLCPCRESRMRGVICAHSLAVGLQFLSPVAKPATIGSEERKRPAAASTDEKPVVELAIEGSLRHLEAAIEFRYSAAGVTNPPAEAEALGRLIQLGFREEKGRAVLSGEEAILKFFATELPALRRTWQVREGERFGHVTRDLVRIEPQMAMGEAADGWLDVRLHFAAGGEAVFSMPEIQQLLRGGQAHLRLKNGRIAVADVEQLRDLEEVIRDCDPRQERGAYRIASRHQPYLESSLARWRGQPDTGPANGSPPALGRLQAELRPYQVTGAQWLLAHARAGRGGLLADEMGLGKTVQTLAALEGLPGPKLVVCPSSLVWNWRRETARFLPEFRVLTLDGPAREKRFSRMAEHDLVVTSYALLRRDVEHYRGHSFAAVVLDEAQHIKNPDSQNAKAALSLRAASRFILTGTPVENSVRDLWSLFEFLLPGYLGSRNDFKERYEAPLLNGERGAIWQRLSRRIQPYLLRRRKADILKELPDKIEQILEVELTGPQKATYDQLQEAARRQVDQLTETGAAGAARMRALTALLRLRQACCDLRLFGGELEMESASAKLTALLEILEEARDGGHRVLVFSQFTSMLDLIAAALPERDIRWCRLDGGTKDRQAVVEQFQNDPSVAVFLISLKAGGVGLNLTAADTVVHFDPWWNPAVEAQATDRAHRIGQRRVVTSIKLIARDTIESRVLSLQQKKRSLLAGTVDAEAAIEQMSVEDLRELVA